MSKSILVGVLLVISGFVAVPVHADSGNTLKFDLSAPVSATWTMAQDPGPIFSESGVAFSVFVPDLLIGTTPTPDIISFFNNPGDMGGLNSVLGEIPELTGPQVYSGSEFNPTMSIGVFKLFEDDGTPVTLTVSEVPEPTTLVLVGSGLLAVALKRKYKVSA